VKNEKVSKYIHYYYNKEKISLKYITKDLIEMRSLVIYFREWGQRELNPHDV
jgi:hypothetical protein